MRSKFQDSDVSVSTSESGSRFDGGCLIAFVVSFYLFSSRPNSSQDPSLQRLIIAGWRVFKSAGFEQIRLVDDVGVSSSDCDYRNAFWTVVSRYISFVETMHSLKSAALDSPVPCASQGSSLVITINSHELFSGGVPVAIHVLRDMYNFGQSSSRGAASVSTNVNRFCHALKIDATPRQIVFYQSGVGTGSLGHIYKDVAGGTGLGLDDNVLDAYTFILNNYLPDDEIYIYGFSRGAFTARVLAGLIIRIGIFVKAYSWELKRAFKAYRGGTDEFDKYCKTLAWKCKKDIEKEGRPRSQKVKIKVVGCWDTVGSMGGPEYSAAKHAFAFYDPRLLGGIEHAFHALALDEIRYAFTPTLWYLPEGAEEDINLEQCWFPGVHTNVGGGYSDQHLADLTLAWMVDRCRPFLEFDEDYISMCIKLDHEPQTINSALRRENGGYDLVYPGWALGRLYDSYRDSGMKLWKYRTPAAYDLPGPTNESIHASVRERWVKDPKWRPKSLEHFEPKEKEDGTYEWVRKATKDGWIYKGQKELVIAEREFPEDKGSFEWRLRYGN
ncbi:hypothetical protein A0H81_14340 [Grifola frondosa]|uniref:T6SS Phospholipase effector Tle1-like catalytic domain-containing protein n=1 Tax=Grifola frondosa TaxID=5627 RepID=A0A1C7LNV6_GRIFR|nr:hypothetical protein A0H81_14340 [Grifola frondosa]